MSVSDNVYESAVNGRREFRRALRLERAKLKSAMQIIDAYGLQLLVIQEGAADPAGQSRKAIKSAEDAIKELRR